MNFTCEAMSYNEIMKAIQLCNICHIAMCKDNIPYVVPMYYRFYELDNTITFSFVSRSDTKKICIINENQNICIGIKCYYDNCWLTIVIDGYVSHIEKYNNISQFKVISMEITGRKYKLYQ